MAFMGNNCNAMFGRLSRYGHGNNVVAKLKIVLNTSLIGVGCPAYVLNNCIHHGAKRMSINIENTINKIYQSHSKTRGFSSFPGITRLIQMFLPIISFLLQEHPPTIIKQFFEIEMSELYLWHFHSHVCLSHTYLNSGKSKQLYCRSADKFGVDSRNT